MKIETVGLDIAKQIFQTHGVDRTGKVVLRKRLRRAEVGSFFAGLDSCLIGLEASGGAHYWFRVLSRLGHTVRLIAPQFVKPYAFYALTLAILEPSRYSDLVISSRLYCNPKALWKLNWFLSDFGYDTEMLGRDEVDETQLVGLKGIVKISRVFFHGTSLLRLDGFAPAGRWQELSPANLDSSQVA